MHSLYTVRRQNCNLAGGNWKVPETALVGVCLDYQHWLLRSLVQSIDTYIVFSLRDVHVYFETCLQCYTKICIYIYIYHLHKYILYIYTSLHIFVYIYIFWYAYTLHINKYLYRYSILYIYWCKYIAIYLISAFIYIYVDIALSKFISIWFIYIYIHIYICTYIKYAFTNILCYIIIEHILKWYNLDSRSILYTLVSSPILTNHSFQSISDLTLCFLWSRRLC